MREWWRQKRTQGYLFCKLLVCCMISVLYHHYNLDQTLSIYRTYSQIMQQMIQCHMVSEIQTVCSIYYYLSCAFSGRNIYSNKDPIIHIIHIVKDCWGIVKTIWYDIKLKWSCSLYDSQEQAQQWPRYQTYGPTIQTARGPGV